MLPGLDKMPSKLEVITVTISLVSLVALTCPVGSRAQQMVVADECSTWFCQTGKAVSFCQLQLELVALSSVSPLYLCHQYQTCLLHLSPFRVIAATSVHIIMCSLVAPWLLSGCCSGARWTVAFTFICLVHKCLLVEVSCAAVCAGQVWLGVLSSCAEV